MTEGTYNKFGYRHGKLRSIYSHGFHDTIDWDNGCEVPPPDKPKGGKLATGEK